MFNDNQMMHTKLFWVAGLFLLSSGQATANSAHIGMGNYSFSGTVMVTPCQIAPGSEEVPVDFKKVSVSDLYLNGKSEPFPFSIHLNCSNTVFKTVTVTFSGIKNQYLPDHLAINSLNGASGIGIGLLNKNDTPIKLDTPSLAQNLSGNNTEIEFKAYIEVEPDALSDEAITYGEFFSTANYTLDYQ